jgi:uncharacterized protein (DUF305 family)
MAVPIAAQTTTVQAPAWLNWRAAALLGLITSTWSTVAVSLGAARVGRVIEVDWMIVGAVLLREVGLVAEPGWRELAAGILVHQSADFFWAVVFFGLLGRWTGRLGPWAILALAVPWALLTSSIEYFLWLPWLQPLFVMQNPYWPGLGVHVISASLYPIFPWLRDRLAGRASPHGGFTRVWASLAVLGLVLLAVLGWLGQRDREIPLLALLDGQPAVDQRFLRLMTFHHAMGVELAREAAARADDPELRRLASLMIADQSGEMDIMGQWWRSWIAPEVPPLSPEEHAAMPGMPAAEELAALEAVRGSGFDALFLPVMSRHHAGAIAMANDALAGAVDLRVWLLAQSVRHAQRNQIAMMRRLAAGRSLEEPMAPGETPASEDEPAAQG